MTSFLRILFKPIAYVSLPVLILKSALSISPEVAYYAGLGLYGITITLASAFGLVAAIGMSAAGRKYDVNSVVARLFYAISSRAMGIRVDVEGIEHLQTRPAVLLSNHQSMLDIIILGRLFPQRTSIMAKKELRTNPALGPWMILSGAVFVDRGNSAAAQRSLAAAGNLMRGLGTSLWVYPEGTRSISEEPKMRPFKKGGFHLAVQANIPVIPIVVENYWRLYHKGFFQPGTIKVKVLPPIPTDGLTTEDVGSFSERVHDQMLATLEEISVKVIKKHASVTSSSTTATTTSVPPPAPTTTSTAALAKEPVPPLAPEPEPEVPSTATEGSEVSSSSDLGHSSRSRRNGSETDEDMVLVDRPVQ